MQTLTNLTNIKKKKKKDERKKEQHQEENVLILVFNLYCTEEF